MIFIFAPKWGSLVVFGDFKNCLIIIVIVLRKKNRTVLLLAKNKNVWKQLHFVTKVSLYF
jgi:hypothetical protein